MLTLTDRSSLLISMQIEYDELVYALSKLDDYVKSGPDQIPPTSLSVAFLLLPDPYYHCLINHFRPVYFQVDGSPPTFFPYSNPVTRIT